MEWTVIFRQKIPTDLTHTQVLQITIFDLAITIKQKRKSREGCKRGMMFYESELDHVFLKSRLFPQPHVVDLISGSAPSQNHDIIKHDLGTFEKNSL